MKRQMLCVCVAPFMPQCATHYYVVTASLGQERTRLLHVRACVWPRQDARCAPFVQLPTETKQSARARELEVAL